MTPSHDDEATNGVDRDLHTPVLGKCQLWRQVAGAACAACLHATHEAALDMDDRRIVTLDKRLAVRHPACAMGGVTLEMGRRGWR